MNLDSSPDSLAALWRRQLEMGLEAGETPVLSVGWDSLRPDSLRSLGALHRLARSRPGAIEPWIVAAGEGDLWLLAAAQWPQEIGQGGPLYGGNDSATFAATLSLVDSARPAATSVPRGMAWMLTPTAMPGSERSEVEYLPFALAPDEFSPLSTSDAPRDWVGQLEGWAVVLLATALLIVSLIR